MNYLRREIRANRMVDVVGVKVVGWLLWREMMNLML